MNKTQTLSVQWQRYRVALIQSAQLRAAGTNARAIAIRQRDAAVNETHALGVARRAEAIKRLADADTDIAQATYTQACALAEWAHAVFHAFGDVPIEWSAEGCAVMGERYRYG
jgi:hypothetical protein